MRRESRIATLAKRRVPLEKRMRITRLYVQLGATAQEIAADMKMPVATVANVIKNNGLLSQRTDFESKAISAVAEFDQAKVEKRIIDEVTAEVGSKSAELTLGSLDLAARKLERQDALGVKLSMSAAKDAYAMFRTAKGLDREGNGTIGGAIPLNILVRTYVDAPRREEKVAEPVEAEVAF